MRTLRQLDLNLKLYACFAILTCLSTAGALWILAQLSSLSPLTVAAWKNFNLSGARFGVCLYIVLTPLAAAGLAGWLRAEVARPVREAIAAARRVAAGDLGTKVGSGAGGGELLTSMQDMNDKLIGMIVKVRNGAEHIASGAGDIARGSRELPARAQEQAEALDAAAASVEQLTVSVRQNAERARQASLLARSASQVAHQGAAVVADAVSTVASIRDSSHRIAEMVSVIDDIAFQTNILALGAAVEAARAGEQGRGVAVVAAEVRDLAQRCAAAARDIKLLINDSGEKTGAWAALADTAGKHMQDIVVSAKRATDITEGIADASALQGIGIEQLNRAIAAMDQRTRQHAALLKQSSTAAAAVRDQAGSLSRAIGGFILDPEHGAAPQIHLAHSNPNKLPRPAPDGKQRPKFVAVRAQGPSPVLKPVRSGGPAASRDLDWEKL